MISANNVAGTAKKINQLAGANLDMYLKNEK